ncbi:MAG: hypothetical protein F9K24_15715 [Leptonema illini]|uniref:Uncharacterized protein n=1 Tax=Leptonema illini TaxID=183 RepID=A0A833GZJ6_9LEPT|nr:MAG: hypothetical protein F9K24_15715 [Leptonema illini]
MKRKILSILICSLLSVASCMQAEKVSLDTSGAEGLLLSGLSIELGLFGGSGDGGTLAWNPPETVAVLSGPGRPSINAGISSTGTAHVLFADSPNTGQTGTVIVKVAHGATWINQTLDSISATLYAPLPLDLAVNASGAAIATWYNTQNRASFFAGAGTYAVPTTVTSYCTSPAVALWSSGHGLMVCGSLSSFEFNGTAFSGPTTVNSLSTNDNALAYTPAGLTVYSGWYQAENHVYTYSTGSGWIDRSGPGNAMNIPTAADLNDSGQLLTIVSDGFSISGYYWNGAAWDFGTNLYSLPHQALRTTLDSSGNGVAAWAGAGSISIRFFSGGTWAPTNINLTNATIGTGPVIAASETGRAYIAWTETSGSNATVQVATLNLSSQAVVNTVTVGTGSADSLLDIAVSSAGHVIVAWSDTGISGCAVSGRCIKTAIFR